MRAERGAEVFFFSLCSLSLLHFFSSLRFLLFPRTRTTARKNGQAQIGPPRRAGRAPPVQAGRDAGAAVARGGGEVRRREKIHRSKREKRRRLVCAFALCLAFLVFFSSFLSLSLFMRAAVALSRTRWSCKKRPSKCSQTQAFQF